MSVYYTIENIENILYKDKASKFIGFAYSVKDENEIKHYLQQLRNVHPKATHHCYAYRLGLDKNTYRMNDDGEPNGTAGKPILGQIDSIGVTNCLVVIVRYFGGTKLGVSGLITAYKESSKLVLSETKIIEQRILNYYKLQSAYENLNIVYRIIQQTGAHLVEQHIDTTSSFVVTIAPEQTIKLEQMATEAQLKCTFIETK